MDVVSLQRWIRPALLNHLIHRCEPVALARHVDRVDDSPSKLPNPLDRLFRGHWLLWRDANRASIYSMASVRCHTFSDDKLAIWCNVLVQHCVFSRRLLLQWIVWWKWTQDIEEECIFTRNNWHDIQGQFRIWISLRLQLTIRTIHNWIGQRLMLQIFLGHLLGRLEIVDGWNQWNGIVAARFLRHFGTHFLTSVAAIGQFVQMIQHVLFSGAI